MPDIEETLVALVQKSLDDLEEAEIGEDEGWLDLSIDEKAVIAALSLAYLEALKFAAEELVDELYRNHYIDAPALPENIIFALESPFVRNYLEQRAMEMVRNINEGTRFYLRRVLLSSVVNGLTEGEIAARIRAGIDINQILQDNSFMQRMSQEVAEELRGLSDVRIRSIVSYELRTVENMARLDQYKRAGLTRKAWQHLGPDTPCELCVENEALGYVPIDYEYQGTFGMLTAPTAHPHCILPGNEVVIPDLVSAMKSFYQGRCVEIMFKSGRRISVTKNHPILTPYGWVVAEKIRTGDDVIVASNAERIASSINPNYEYRPTKIEDVFCALNESKKMSSVSVPASSEYLHGEGNSIKGDINVVFANSPLLSTFIPETAEFCCESGFYGGNSNQVGLVVDGSCLKFGEGSFASPDSVLCGKHVGGSVGLRDIFPSRVLGLGVASWGDSRFDESIPQYTSCDASLAAKFVLRFASYISFDEVVNIRYYDFSGHVYDLQSKLYGLYNVNGVIVKNCHCRIVYDRGELFSAYLRGQFVIWHGQ